jgi:hypothetical protein
MSLLFNGEKKMDSENIMASCKFDDLMTLTFLQTLNSYPNEMKLKLTTHQPFSLLVKFCQKA